MSLNSIHCSIKYCPCLKPQEAILCGRHFAMIRDVDRQYLLFFTRTGDLGTYWRLWRALIANLVDFDRKFLAKFSNKKLRSDAYPTPLTGVCRRTDPSNLNTL